MYRALLLLLLLAWAMTGCTGKVVSPPSAPPTPPLVEPTAPAKPATPTVVKEGAALRLTRAPDLYDVTWAPSGQTALVGGVGHYRLRLEPPELLPVNLGSFRIMGWTGSDDLLLLRSDETSILGELSLVTGEWRSLAEAPGHISLCPSGENWVWVEVAVVRSGGAGSREIGAVYRGPKPVASSTPGLLVGERVLERGALLGRLADGSCLLDRMDQRLLLLRPDGRLETLAEGFLVPYVTEDEQGVIWHEEMAECDECVELGPGVPFRRLVWWRLDGTKLVADLSRPQVLTPLLSPDGQRLIIGRRDWKGEAGAIGLLTAEGFDPGEPRSPAPVPIGWMGADLLTMPAPSRWARKGPVHRWPDGAEVGQWLAGGVDWSQLLLTPEGVRYLSPAGKVYRPSHQEPFLEDGGGIDGLGVYTPQAPYIAIRQDDGLLLVRLEAP